MAYAEQQTAVDYGVPSFVVADAVWAKNKGRAPAFCRRWANLLERDPCRRRTGECLLRMKSLM